MATAATTSATVTNKQTHRSEMDEETRILELLEEKFQSINTLKDDWISDIAKLIHQCFKLDSRKAVRLKAIATLSQIFNTYAVIYEDELMERLIIPNFADGDQESDLDVIRPIIHLLFDVLSNCMNLKNSVDVLTIVRRILIKPFKMIQASATDASDLVYIFGNADVIDSRLAITCLNKLFRARLFSLPIDSAVIILDILVSYLNHIYRCPFQAPIPAEIPMILQELFSLFMNLRCNEHGYLGIKPTNQNDNCKIRYSPFVICVKRPSTYKSTTFNGIVPKSDLITSSSSLINVNSFAQSDQSILMQTILAPNGYSESKCINLDGIFIGIVACINSEANHEVLCQVLERLPEMLSSKSLLSSVSNELINQLCLSLSELTRSVERRFSRMPQKNEIVQYCLKCLTSLLVYRDILEPITVKAFLNAFTDSLKVSQPVVPWFTTCLVELHDLQDMARVVKQLLDRLPKFSATTQLAHCRLEFLSYLILFPKLYESFTIGEYKHIFATALPYTNPLKFTDYITCLAFRIIAMWYLECRPAFRSELVEYIRRSLQSNVIQPFKENTIISYSPTSTHPTATLPLTHSCPPATNYDQRKRSCSLNTENSLRRFEYRQGSVTSIMSHLAKVPSSPPPNSPSSPFTNTFSFNSNHATSAFGFPNNQLSLQLNEELIETFADLLSRYTHGQCSFTSFKRYPCAEFLLDKSQSMTWLHGNMLVTITTSSSNLGWAEILIRRPTGNMSWIGRLQNSSSTTSCSSPSIGPSLDCQLNIRNEIISLFSTMSLTDEISDPDSGYNSASTPASVTSDPATPLANISNSNCTASYRLKDPIPLKDSKSELAVKNFDRITPYETHKIGVVYVNKGQAENKTDILLNKHGSIRYMEFLKKLGLFINLADIDTKVHFIGGLDTNGEDGKYTYYWQDKMTQVIFHVATLMPNRDDDPHCNNKHRHIGNDHVCIVYNDSKEKFQLSTIKGEGQCIMAAIVVTPLETDTNLVSTDIWPELSQIFNPIEPKVLTNNALSLYVRQLAIHLNLASMIYERRQRSVSDQNGYGKSQYVSNWVERLRCIKRIRKRLEEANNQQQPGNVTR